MRTWLKVQQVAKEQIFFLHRLSVKLIKRLLTIFLSAPVKETLWRLDTLLLFISGLIKSNSSKLTQESARILIFVWFDAVPEYLWYIC